jgi:hypothetical protein
MSIEEWDRLHLVDATPSNWITPCPIDGCSALLDRNYRRTCSSCHDRRRRDHLSRDSHDRG